MIKKDLPGIPVLDSLRGFAAISVCLFHFVYSTINFVDDGWVRTFFFQGIFGVQTFFVISGFIIPYSMYRANYQFKNFFSFFAKRLLRLEPPYLFSLLAVLLLLVLKNVVSGSDLSSTFNIKQIALHFGYLIPFFQNYSWLNEVYWTLAVEFQFYLFIALVFVLLIRMPTAGRYLFYVGTLALSCVGSYQFLPNALPFFLLGILLFLSKAELIKTNELNISIVITAVFIGFNYQPGSLIFGMITVLAILFFSNYKVPGLHKLGKFSYSIYLIHPIVGSTLINVLSHHAKSPFHKVGIVLAGMVATVVASWLMYLIVEKPSQRFSKSIEYGK